MCRNPCHRSTTPAILVIFMGEPQFKPVEANRTDTPFALNTNWDVIYDTASELYYLLNADGWCLPGKAAQKAPRVFATTEPAELIVTDGALSYIPVRGTKLLRVNNTESVLFLHSGNGKFHFLVAGRWFRSDSLDGPWMEPATIFRPTSGRFRMNNPAAYVKASVPGTREARDAVLLASLPTTTRSSAACLDS